MTLPIVSNSGQASLWSGLLKSGFSMGGLYGVDDDNTLAESGVYNSFNSLRDAGNNVFRSLNADASSLSAAAMSYARADSASAAGFR